MQAKSNYLYLLRLSYNSHCSDGWSLQYGEAQPQDVSAHDEDEGGGAGGDCGGPDGRGAVQCKKSLVVCWISEVCRYENFFFFFILLAIDRYSSYHLKSLLLFNNWCENDVKPLKIST